DLGEARMVEIDRVFPVAAPAVLFFLGVLFGDLVRYFFGDGAGILASVVAVLAPAGFVVLWAACAISKQGE
ncbi:hypothetical protein RZS08_03080, partial [Arthrospira platensis SPKY1]|nr:hypothetical protein [Arthrospira platensis SPKY1]